MAKDSRLDAWVRTLSLGDVPLFARTAERIAALLDRDDSSSSEIAAVVLQDAVLTTHVLKLANSSAYNVSGRRFTTVSRAVVVLGFDTVRALCLSASLIKTVLGHRSHRDLVERLLARSVHAAVQARGLAFAAGLPNPEEIYVAALLRDLGGLLFWSRAGSQGAELAARLACRPGEADVVEQEVLGFRLARLTAALNDEWRLSPVLSGALEGRAGPGPECVRLAVALATAAEQGWSSPAVTALLGQVDRQLEIAPSQLRTLLADGSREAVEILARHAPASVGARIPSLTADGSGEPEPQTPDAPAWNQPDPMLELQVMRDLGALLAEPPPSLSLLFNLVLEGIHRGVGMDRTVLALLTPDRRALRAKYVLGDGNFDLLARFDRPPEHPDGALAQLAAPRWLKADSPLRCQLARALGDASGFMAPVAAHRQPIGLVYADRATSQRPLDDAGFESFLGFVRFASLGISLARSA